MNDNEIHILLKKQLVTFYEKTVAVTFYFLPVIVSPIIFLTFAEQIWVIIRDRTYTSDLKKRVREKIVSLGLDTSRLINRQQYSCPANYWENEKRYNSI